MKKALLLLLMIAGSVSVHAENVENTEKIEVSSCDRKLQFDKPPQRAVSHDINLTEMMFALKLQDHMIGYSGISNRQKMTASFKAQAGNLQQLSVREPSLETLLTMQADFLFAGWSYGLRVGSPLTPAALQPFNIAVYELTESCIRIMNKQPASFADVYNDLTNLATIFAVESRAEILIDDFKQQLKLIQDKTSAVTPVSVFVYDSGKSSPFTAGLYAMPNTMIAAAGGKNIVDDINTSWIRTSWETVVERNPEVIVIVDYGNESAAEKISFLNNHPALAQVNAIVNRRFVIISYAEATPGVRNIDATRRMAKAFHTQRFSHSPLLKPSLAKTL